MATDKAHFDDTWAALGSAHIAFEEEAPGVVQINGKDARRFVHRLSTQHVVDRPAPSACLNAFLDKKGRVRHLVHHVTLGEERVLLVASPLSPAGEGARLAEWLSAFHFAEDLTIVDESASMRVTMVAGRALPADWSALASEGVRVVGESIVLRTFDLRVDDGAPVPALLVVAPRDAPPLISAPRGDDEALACARIASCVPIVGAEVTDAVNPLELGLEGAIHWDKGCYTGQEVISRIENRGKQARALVGLVAEGDVGVGDVVRAGDEELGIVTSVAPHARAGLPRALAILRTQADVTTLPLRVVHDGVEQPARAVRARH